MTGPLWSLNDAIQASAGDGWPGSWRESSLRIMTILFCLFRHANGRDGIDRGLLGRHEKRGVLSFGTPSGVRSLILGASTLSSESGQGGLTPSTSEALRHRPEATSRGHGPRLPHPRLDGAGLNTAHAMEPKLTILRYDHH